MSASVNNAYAIPLYIAIGLALVFFVTIVVWFAMCFFKNKNWLVCGIATTGLVVMIIVSGTVGQAMWLGEHERVKASVVGDATYIVQFDGKDLYRDRDQIFYVEYEDYTYTRVDATEIVEKLKSEFKIGLFKPFCGSDYEQR